MSVKRFLNKLMPNFVTLSKEDLTPSEIVYKTQILIGLESELRGRGTCTLILFILGLLLWPLLLVVVYRLIQSSNLKSKILTLKKELGL